MAALEEYERRFPNLDWRLPLKITISAKAAPDPLYACRICIGEKGFKAAEWESAAAFRTEQEFEHHLREEHGV